MVRKLSWISTGEEDIKGLQEAFIPPEYRIFSHDQLPHFIPKGLLSKTNSAIGLASTTSDGTTILLLNLRRLDEKQDAIDQEPFVFVFVSNDPALQSGALDNCPAM